MDSNLLKEILEETYTFEGLIRVAMDRAAVTMDLEQLVQAKALRLRQLLDLLAPSMPQESYPSSAPEAEENYYSENEHEEISTLEIFDEEDEEPRDIESVEGKRPDMSYFTIVEKVNFRQTLFNGNKRALDDLMNKLEMMTGYAQAEQFLRDEMHFIPESDETHAAFMTKLHECFRMGEKI